jgi:hypothetical protein
MDRDDIYVDSLLGIIGNLVTVKEEKPIAFSRLCVFIRGLWCRNTRRLRLLQQSFSAVAPLVNSLDYRYMICHLKVADRD